MTKPGSPPPTHVTNFIRNIIEHDLETGKYASRTWSGKPGPASVQATGRKDPARIRTRFPPEPNGYLHFGHAKSICLNFGVAQDYAGICHMRFDDTNPVTEETEYVDSILDAVHWLGFDWGEHLYYASDYFDYLYQFAEAFVQHGLAYVDELTADEMREFRGTLTEAGKNSPWRDRPIEESLDLFRRMRAGEFSDGTYVLRLKIDMTSPNINMRDPVAYRIRHAHHHRTGDKWCIYPSYDFTHGVSDALENITHSLCTLEFEDHRPLYDWLNERLADFAILKAPLPQQIEFARLNLTNVVLSKRKLIQLVDERHVLGWDDPRMPTLAGARRRGYTAEGFRRFAEKIGVSKANQLIDFGVLEESMREHLNEVAPRRMAVLDPVKLVIDNFPAERDELASVPNHPQKPDWGKREVPFSRELWIERDDFALEPPKGYFRLYPGNEVRLRFGYVVKCTGIDNGVVHCTYHPDSKSGTPGADKYKVKGNIHWVSVRHAHASSVHLYDRLFRVPNPGAERDFIEDLNPDSMKSITAQLEPSLAAAKPGESLQFERHGYFVRDRDGKAFNRTVTLRDSWSKS